VETKVAVEAQKAADAKTTLAAVVASVAAAVTPEQKRIAESKAMVEGAKAQSAANRAEAAIKTAAAAAAPVAPSAPKAPTPPAASAEKPAGGGTAAPAASGSSGTKVASTSAQRRARDASCKAAGQTITLPGWYTVKRGDSLSKVAVRFYQDGSEYTRIYKTNRRKIENVNVIYPCQRIYLPRP
jgi:colicin import membrane protein